MSLFERLREISLREGEVDYVGYGFQKYLPNHLDQSNRPHTLSCLRLIRLACWMPSFIHGWGFRDEQDFVDTGAHLLGNYLIFNTVL